MAQGFDNRGRIEYAASVRFLFLTRVLFALLAFQLGVGLQVGVAHAATDAAPVRISGPVHLHEARSAGSDAACPMHDSRPQSSPHAERPQESITFGGTYVSLALH